MKELEIDWEVEKSLKDGKSHEIEILEMLPAHPNVVQYFFHQRVNNRLQIFLKCYQKCLHKEIIDRVANATPFGPLEIVLIALDLSNGLCHLHKNKVYHRGWKALLSLLYSLIVLILICRHQVTERVFANELGKGGKCCSWRLGFRKDCYQTFASGHNNWHSSVYGPRDSEL